MNVKSTIDDDVATTSALLNKEPLNFKTPPALSEHGGAKVIATALRDAGMDVIYTGLRQTPEMVVNAALQEDVDVIGVSILSGAHNTVFPKIIQVMKEKELKDVLLIGGGIIPDDDMLSLNAQGVARLFAPGTSTVDIVSYINEWVAANRQF